MTPYEILCRRPDQGRPLITGYWEPDQRTELSVATAANGVAKAAGFLRDELDVAQTATVSIDLPAHWQVGIWTLAALSVGARVGRKLPYEVEARICGPQAASEGEVRLPARDLIICACDAFGMPVPGGVPAGMLDAAIEVRAHPDRLAVDPGASGRATLLHPSRDWAWPDLLAGDRARTDASWVDEQLADQDLLMAVAVAPVLHSSRVVLGHGLTPERAAQVRRAEGFPDLERQSADG
jgi:uncharacterized protein (TIGR03089 family)